MLEKAFFYFLSWVGWAVVGALIGVVANVVIRFAAKRKEGRRRAALLAARGMFNPAFEKWWAEQTPWQDSTGIVLKDEAKQIAKLAYESADILKKYDRIQT